MAKAGEVSTHGVCHSLTQFSEMEFLFLFIVAVVRVWDGCAEGRKTRGLGLRGASLKAACLFCRAGSHWSWEPEAPELGV